MRGLIRLVSASFQSAPSLKYASAARADRIFLLLMFDASPWRMICATFFGELCARYLGRGLIKVSVGKN